MGIALAGRARGIAALTVGMTAATVAMATAPRERDSHPWGAIGATAAVGTGALLGGQLLRGPFSQLVRAAGTGALLAAGIGAALSLVRASSSGGGSTAASSQAPSSAASNPTPSSAPDAQPASTSTAAPTAAGTPAAGTSEAQAPPTTSEPAVDAPWMTGTMLKVDMRGPEIAALKERLASLHYAIDEPEGTDEQLYTWELRDAVMAFQKVHGLERDGVAGPETQAALLDPQDPQLGDGPADRVDVDLSDQVLVVVRGGEIDYIVNATTGDPDHPDGMGEVTPIGEWTVDRQIEGIRDAPLGRIYWPSYFKGGIAVHGSASIMAERASHGCVRVPRSLEERIHRDMPIGSAVVVHE